MSLFCSPVSLFVILITLSFAPNALQAQNYTAFFIFGDSTLDPGNNNYINATLDNKANYPPYGRKGIHPDQPTGRFSDGRIFVDFIAEYAGLPLIPDMLGPPSPKEYKYGVNFGSAGAGILNTTNRDQGVIDLDTQLEYFDEVERELKQRLGDDKARNIISNAVYFFSMGSNDYLGGYLNNPEMQQRYHNPADYVEKVAVKLSNAIQILYWNKGARKFGFLSVPPLGCLPFMRAINPESEGGSCFYAGNYLARAHNNYLNDRVLGFLGSVLPGFKYSICDSYHSLIDRMDNPSAYGFKEGIKACCGTGPYNGIYSCGGKKSTTSVYEVCDNGDDYVFWDSFHPTEKMHEQIARTLWNGTRESVRPFNLQELFNNSMNNNNNDDDHHVVNIAEA